MRDENDVLAAKPEEIPVPAITPAEIAEAAKPAASAAHGVLDEIETLVASFRIGEYTVEFAQALRAKLRELRTKL